MSDMYNNEFESAAEKMEQNKKKEKKTGGVKKFFAAVFLGLSFGVVAALAFNGTNKVIDKLFDNKKAVEEEKPQEIEQPKEPEIKEEPEKREDAFNKDFFGENDIKPGFMNNGDGPLTVQEVVAESMPSIVAITNKSIQELRSFYGMGIQEYEAVSAGSGIIIGQNDTELLIVSNAHVVEGADTLTVCCIDGEAYEAVVKGADSDNDLAVIAVSLSDVSGSTLDAIKIAKMGDSEKLEIGEQVVAIGNAMGYGQSVTTGIVSALNRTIDGSDDGKSFIQTDAAINPGNSGGALLNMAGEVVGINSAKLANTKIEGMGYAIPISAASDIVDGLMNLITRSRVDESEAGYLGISGFSVTDEVANAYSIPKGIYVSETTEGTAAQKAGIQKGDVILKFDGMSVDSINKLRDRLDYYKAGESVDVVIARADEGEYKERTITVVLDGREGTPLESNPASKGDKGPDDSDDDSADDGNGNQNNQGGQRNGQFNFGGSTFQYSLPDNLFDFFGR